MSDTKLPGRLVIMALVLLLVSLATLLGIVVAMRFNSLWALLLAPFALPVLAMGVAVLVRLSRGRPTPETTVDGPAS